MESALGFEARGSIAAAAPVERELRYVLDRAQAAAFLHAVAAHTSYEVYDQARPLAFARTTYLDTDDWDYFRSCDGPVMERIRIREYAAAAEPRDEPVLTGVCFLELKRSAGSVRQKLRFRAPPEILTDLVDRRGETDPDWMDALEALDAFALIRARLQEREMRPRMTTWYHRASLTGEEGRVRITVDEGIAFCRPTEMGAPGSAARPPETVAYGPGRMVEVKHAGEAPAWLARALGGLVAEPHFSKFRVGVQIVRDAGEVVLPHSTTLLAVPERLRAAVPGAPPDGGEGGRGA